MEKAVKESEENGMSKRGKEATPWILRRVGELTLGRSIPSSKFACFCDLNAYGIQYCQLDIALIENTAYIGGRIAAAYTRLHRSGINGSNVSDCLFCLG